MLSHSSDYVRWHWFPLTGTYDQTHQRTPANGSYCYSHGSYVRFTEHTQDAVCKNGMRHVRRQSQRQSLRKGGVRHCSGGGGALGAGLKQGLLAKTSFSLFPDQKNWSPSAGRDGTNTSAPLRRPPWDLVTDPCGSWKAAGEHVTHHRARTTDNSRDSSQPFRQTA